MIENTCRAVGQFEQHRQNPRNVTETHAAPAPGEQVKAPWPSRADVITGRAQGLGPGEPWQVLRLARHRLVLIGLVNTCEIACTGRPPPPGSPKEPLGGRERPRATQGVPCLGQGMARGRSLRPVSDQATTGGPACGGTHLGGPWARRVLARLRSRRGEACRPGARPRAAGQGVALGAGGTQHSTPAGAGPWGSSVLSPTPGPLTLDATKPSSTSPSSHPGPAF